MARERPAPEGLALTRLRTPSYIRPQPAGGPAWLMAE